MKATSPQILYILLILPLAFGVTLFGEGLHKLINDDKSGAISAFFGAAIILSAFLIYFVVSNVL